LRRAVETLMKRNGMNRLKADSFAGRKIGQGAEALIE
jgi:hypothetical protein